MGICAELVAKFELTRLKFDFEYIEPDKHQDKSDFRLKAQYGPDIFIEVKSCPSYGDSVIIEGEKTEFDYLIGVKILYDSAKIVGYLPKELGEGFPFYQVGEHPRTPIKPGRPIPLSGLMPIGGLWESLKTH